MPILGSASKEVQQLGAKDGDLDKDLVKFFVKSELHLEYAKKHLSDDQIDEITVDFDKL